MAVTEERVYIAGIALLLLGEIILAIPLVPDSLVMEGSTFIAVLSIGHFFWWLFGKTGMVNGINSVPHILGMFGVIVSLVPIVGFLWHGIVAFNLYKSMLKMLKDEIGRNKKVENEDKE